MTRANSSGGPLAGWGGAVGLLGQQFIDSDFTFRRGLDRAPVTRIGEPLAIAPVRDGRHGDVTRISDNPLALRAAEIVG